MKQLNLFIQITRLNRPIGYLLLFWPCLWGLTLAYDSSISINIYIFYIILFFLGSLFMRSAGCIVNDISDKNFDKKVILEYIFKKFALSFSENFQSAQNYSTHYFPS